MIKTILTPIIKLHSLTSRAATPVQALLRSFGAGILTFLSPSCHEVPKILVDPRRSVAFGRCAIHVLPSCLSIALVALSGIGYFIGKDLQGEQGNDDMFQALLQVAAKVQELLIVASLATIIQDMIRQALMEAYGVPLGLLTSGFSFTQLRFVFGLAIINSSSSSRSCQWYSSMKTTTSLTGLIFQTQLLLLCRVPGRNDSRRYQENIARISSAGSCARRYLGGSGRSLDGCAHDTQGARMAGRRRDLLDE